MTMLRSSEAIFKLLNVRDAMRGRINQISKT